jgi:hypothetical protein
MTDASCLLLKITLSIRGDTVDLCDCQELLTAACSSYKAAAAAAAAAAASSPQPTLLLSRANTMNAMQMPTKML